MKEIFSFGAKPGVVDWAEANLELPPRMTAMPGRFSTFNRPYQREPLECYHPDSGVNDLILCMGTQAAKTMIKTVGTLYRIDQAPGPILWVAPTQNFGRSWSKSRWMPLVEGNPTMAKHLPENHDNYTVMEQHFRDCTFNIAWSNSPSELASRPVQILDCDEVCKFAYATTTEASALQLAESRTKTFESSAFRAKSSTPTTPEHEFWLQYQTGDQRHLWVPCPHCREPFVFQHRRYNGSAADWDPTASGADAVTIDGEMESGAEYSLTWDKSALVDGIWDERLVRKSAKYQCPHCGNKIEDWQKPGMVLEGCESELVGWRRSNLAADENFRSYHLPSFYAPDVSFGDMALKFLRGRNLFGLQDYFNSWLSLPWAQVAAVVKDRAVLDMRSDYRQGVIPFMPAAMYMTADPGEKRTHWMAIAESAEGELAVVDYGTVLSIEDLRELPRKSWKVRGTDRSFACRFGLIDSGDFTKRVYSFCTAEPFWHPTKGSDAAFGSWSFAQPKSHPRVTLYTYTDKQLKDELYEDRIMRKNPPRVWLPENAGSDLIAGITGQEKKVMKDSRGRTTAFWKKLPEDHYGDCLKLGVFGQWLTRDGLKPPAS